MRRCLGAACSVLAGCGLYFNDPSPAPDAPGPTYTEVALIPVTINRDLDVLFVIQDSNSMLDKQNNLKANFPTLVNELSSLPDGLPNIHLGVISTDLGTSGADGQPPGPPIGVNPNCAGEGKAGNMLINGAPVTGAYLADIRNTDGTRTTNYTGTIADAFAAMASLGAEGCAFEQHLEAAKRALDPSNAANAGFLRPDANLAVIDVGDEDDCSIDHATLLDTDTTTLGVLGSFRCTRFGVTCDTGGQTTDEMNQAGDKTGCHSNDSDQYLTDLGRYLSFFQSIKPDPRNVMFAAIIGDPSPVDVELFPPPGGGSATMPTLRPSCLYQDPENSTEGADPAVRIAQLAGTFERNVVSTICQQDLSPQEIAIGRQLRNLVGDTCVPVDIPMPPDCVAFDVTGNVPIPLPACSSQMPTDCFQLVTDAAACPDGQHLRLDVPRSHAPPPSAMTSLRCKL